MRKVSASIVAFSLLLACGACAPGGDVPTPTPATHSARPALSSSQREAMEASVFEAIAGADSALNAHNLGVRAAGPFLAQRSAEYALKSILADSYALSRLSPLASQSVVSASHSYPHVALSIMNPAQGSNLQTMNVFTQDDARSLFKLWGVMSILPGATVPGLALDSSGARSLAADSAEGLPASPTAVIAAYASLNQTREDSAGLTFADDALRTKLAASADANAKAVEGAGSATMNFSAGTTTPVALATSDGGALVVAQMDFSSHISITTAQAKIKVGSTIGALASGQAGGEIEVTGSLTANYTVSVAFYVPAAGAADQTIRVVGASDPVLLSAQNG